MKKARILAGCLLAVSLVGGARKDAPNPRAATLLTAAQRAQRVAPFRSRFEQGRNLFASGNFDQAAQIYQIIFQAAQALSQADVAGRALGDWGGCQFAMHQHQAALGAFLEARKLSESAGDFAEAALWQGDLASLYYEMGEFAASAQWIERSLKQTLDPARARHLPELELQMAIIRGQQGRITEASQFFRKGIDGADRQGNQALVALGWSRWGEAFLSRGDLPRAEGALLRAYYTSRLNHLALEQSYRDLGRLRQAQGDIESAAALLDDAVEQTAQRGGPEPTWNLYLARGRVRLAQGNLRAALGDLRIALRLGRAWRWSAPTDDAIQIGNEGVLAQVHAAFIEVGNRLYLETHDPDLAEETFAAVEENRAVSLRALIRDPQQTEPDLPADYWQALGRLQHAEVTALRGADMDDIASARAQLVQAEASLGPELRPFPPDLPETARRVLDKDSAFFSFHLGDSISWVWALDRAGLAVYPLPPRDAIESASRDTVAAISQGRSDASAVSAALFQTLFGPVDVRFRSASRWLVALDAALSDVPIAALVETAAPQPIYVTQRHTVEVVPGAAFWLESLTRPQPRLEPLLVGLGDAIYNGADARLGHARIAADAPVLPRLVASGREIEAAAQAWDGPAVLLRGHEASRENLLEQLRRRPAVVHLATHYLESAAPPRYGLIALSLVPGRQMDLLTPFEISHWHIATGLVVLSGCHSAAGQALPGTGVMGLTRAWLAAGAQSVIGTLWNTPDDDGALFGALYRSLRGSAEFDAARALRAAQMEFIRSGGRHARPEYWGAYFAVGNQGKAVRPQ